MAGLGALRAKARYWLWGESERSKQSLIDDLDAATAEMESGVDTLRQLTKRLKRREARHGNQRLAHGAGAP